MINTFNEMTHTFMSINRFKVMINTPRYNENDLEVHNNDQ